MWTGSGGRRLASLRALATEGEAAEKRQGGRFTAKKKRNPKSQFSSFAKEEKGRLFTGSGERGNPSPKMA